MKNVCLFVFFSVQLLSAQDLVWQNPLPQGKNINSSQAISTNTIYACGDEGLIIKTTNGGETWNILEQVTIRDFTSLYFTDEQYGFIVGRNGIIVNTTNGGINFNILDDNKSYDLNSVVVLDQTILAAGSNGVLLRSTDNGNVWNNLNTADARSISEMYFITTTKGWLTGKDGLLRITIDGGITWQEQGSTLHTLLSTVYFQNEDTGYAAGIEGKIIKTTDGGNNWSQLNTGVTNWIKSIRFFDNNNGIATGSPGIILRTTDGGGTWRTENNTEAFSFTTITKTNESVSWIMGKKGVILKTTNNGVEWEYQSSGIISQLNDINFISSDSGYAVGNNGRYLQTTDGGNTWNLIPLGVTGNLNKIYFFNHNEGWIVGDSAVLLSTSNAGNTWINDTSISSVLSGSLTDFASSRKTRISTGIKFIVGQGISLIGYSDNIPGHLSWNSYFPISKKLNAISVFSDYHSIVAGNEGTLIFRCGKCPSLPIQDLSVSNIYDLMDISTVSNKAVWVVGSYGIVMKAKNRADFRVLTHLNVNRLNAVQFLSDYVGFTAGTAGSVFRTSDGGLNWTRLYTGITNEIKKIHFIDQNTGYLVGKNGLILKLENAFGVPTEINEEEDGSKILDEYILSQNYPNPFNPSTKISWQSPVGSYQTLKVYDVLGREVATLVDEYKEAGSYEVEFDAKNLSSGVYYYQLKVGEFVETKKMILVK